MMRFLRYNLLYALVLTAIVVLGEQAFHIYQYRQPLLGLIIARFVLYIFILGLVLSVIRSHKICIGVMVGIHVVQLVQAQNIYYFGMPISPEIIAHFFSDPAEDSREILASVSLLSASVLLMFLLATTLSVLFIIKRHGRNLSVPGAALFLLGVAWFPYQIAIAAKPHKYYPQMEETLVSNFVNALSLHAFRKEMMQFTMEYEPYHIESLPKTAKNVVLIIGESVNPHYMSLFGYGQDTTPLISEFRKANTANLVVSRMLSTGVFTAPAITKLMNIVREPGNMVPVIQKSHNLIYLAKANGFKTAWIGNQASNNLVYAGIEKADTLITSQTMNPLDYSRDGDDRLLEDLQRYQWGDKNFIVLHLRNLHSPYEENYQHHKELQLYSDDEIEQSPDRQTHTRRTYVNAMRYFDSTLYQLLTHLKETMKDKGESYIFFTSDHGELLGEDGRFGHGFLDMAVVDVPFIAYGVNADAGFMRSIAVMPRPTHYDMSLLVAKKLGYAVQNPNMREGVYYVHSPDMYNQSRYIEYKLDRRGRIVFAAEHQLGEVIHEQHAK